MKADGTVGSFRMEKMKKTSDHVMFHMIGGFPFFFRFPKAG